MTKHVSPTIKKFRNEFYLKDGTLYQLTDKEYERWVQAQNLLSLEQFITQIENDAITRTLDGVEKEFRFDELSDYFIPKVKWKALKQRLTKGSKTEEYTKEGIKEYKDTLIKLGREE